MEDTQKGATLTACKQCSRQRRIKARGLCKGCYEADLLERRIERETASRNAERDELVTTLRSELAQAKADAMHAKQAHRQAEQLITSLNTERDELAASLRALLAEADPFLSSLVQTMTPLQLVASMRKAHTDSIDRWRDKAQRLEDEVTSSLCSQPDEGTRLTIQAAALMAQRGADELKAASTQREAMAGLELSALARSLAGLIDD
jgi:chromosome segregation ATPase